MMRIYGVLLFMEVMMMRGQIFMMMKNEKVFGENYGKWVQGYHGPLGPIYKCTTQ